MKTTTTMDRALTAASLALADLTIHRVEALLRKYRPDQRRVPAGVREGGQFADENGTIRIAIGRRLTKTECWDQYDRDTFHCTMVGLRSCHEQAGQRYAACLAGTQMPPLSY